MNHCQGCGTAFENASHFCGVCGSPLSTPPSEAADTQAGGTAARNISIPFYLRWYSILLSLAVWPGWFPIGPFAAAGLWLVRMRTVPASRGLLGWLITLLGAPWVVLWLFSQTIELPRWLHNFYGVLLLFSAVFTGFGIRLLWQARKATRLVNIIHKQRCRTVAAVAQRLGTNDSQAVTAEISRLKHRGWLEGYEFDPVAGRIYYTAASANFFQTVGRSKLGTCSMAFAAMLSLIFLAHSPVKMLKKQKVDISDAYDMLFSNEMTACDVLPKEVLSRLLNKQFVYAEVVHIKSGTRCHYFVTDPRISQHGNDLPLFWIEYLPRGLPEERGGDWADRWGPVVLDAITDSERARAIRSAMGRKDVQIHDYGIPGIDFEYGNANFAVQSSIAPEWEAAFMLMGKSGGTWAPTVTQFAQIANEVCARIPKPKSSETRWR